MPDATAPTPTTPPAPRDQKQAVRDQFGPAAAHYASAAVHRAGPDLEALVTALEARGDERALDVGCGAGHTALAIAPHVGHVDALDLTQAMLDQVERLAAERGLDCVATRLGDAEAIPFPDASFEIVTCRLCAHHFPRPGRAVAEMHRVLAPGGRLLLIDIVSPELPEVDTFLNAIEIVRDPSHVRDHTIGQWRSMLGHAGFAVADVRTWPMRIAFDAWIERIGAPAEAAVALRWMLDRASDEVRAQLEIDPATGDFTLTNAFVPARRPA
jgi:ubiquinone/menaquinone biosynthesis C-methylase UbiE